MKSTPGLLVALALGLAAWPVSTAHAADPPAADAPAADAKAAIAKFDAAFETQFTTDKLRALRALAKVQSPAVATRILEVMKDKDENVRVAACEGLALQRTSAAKVGAALAKIGFDSDEKPAVVAAAITALGPLGHKKVATEVERLIWSEEDPVVCAALACFGAWKEPSALRTMYEFFDMYPDEKSFATGSVSVDTGASGSGDQAKAAAKWKAKYGSQRNWRPRPECNRALQASLKAITGFGFRRPEDLTLYMDDPKKYPDPERIAERVDEPKRRAAHDAYQAAVAKATEISKKEYPGDAPNDERAKRYWKELRDLRKDILEKHVLRLSELDVIVAEGKTKGWAK